MNEEVKHFFRKFKIFPAIRIITDIPPLPINVFAVLCQFRRSKYLDITFTKLQTSFIVRCEEFVRSELPFFV